MSKIKKALELPTEIFIIENWYSVWQKMILKPNMQGLIWGLSGLLYSLS